MKPTYFYISNDELVRVGPKPKSVIEAIEQAIVKWSILKDRSSEGELVHDGGVDTCCLCIMFRNRACRGCPIGSPGCDGTPYYDYRVAIRHCDAGLASLAAIAEIRFLNRLLKKVVANGG